MGVLGKAAAINMAYKFQVNQESLKRQFAVYVVIAKRNKNKLFYVGKTGDNREGCNPIISRYGNHFSYNNIHSQIRNKIPEHEKWEYTYIFDYFYKYTDDGNERKKSIDKINEMERWLNQEINKIIDSVSNYELLNPYLGKGISKFEQEKRKKLRNSKDKQKIDGIVNEVKLLLN